MKPFNGTFEELQARVPATGRKGLWIDIAKGKQFRCGAGANGFEGLILAHISRLTGRRFFLAKSGPQAGKDARSAGYGATYIDIECKKYQHRARGAGSRRH
jgi:hypothetical protein